MLSHTKDDDAPAIEEVYQRSLRTLDFMKKIGAKDGTEKGGLPLIQSNVKDKFTDEDDCKIVDPLFSSIKGYRYGLKLKSLTIQNMEGETTAENFLGGSLKLIVFEEFVLLVQLWQESYKLIKKISTPETLVENVSEDTLKVISNGFECAITFADGNEKKLIYNIFGKGKSELVH